MVFYGNTEYRNKHGNNSTLNFWKENLFAMGYFQTANTFSLSFHLNIFVVAHSGTDSKPSGLFYFFLDHYKEKHD